MFKSPWHLDVWLQNEVIISWTLSNIKAVSATLLHCFIIQH